MVQRDPALDAQPAGGRELPRRAGVSSFGFGGVNAHVVLEEYLDTRPRTASSGPVAIVLSGKGEERLREQAQRLRAALVHIDDTISTTSPTRCKWAAMR